VKRITYVGTAVLVDDDFGSLLLEYAAALARGGTSETIQFLGLVESDAQEEEVTFIVGPASEIVVERLADGGPADPPDNAGIGEFMKERIQELEGLRPTPRHVVEPEAANERPSLLDGLDI
jgi:hypothetical protein